MFAEEVQNALVDGVPPQSTSEALKDTNAPEQTSTDQPSSEPKLPEQEEKSPGEQLLKQNGNGVEAGSEPGSEEQADKPAENGEIAADGTKESGEKREHDDIDASGEDVPEEAVEEPASKKQKTAAAPAAPNGEKKRGRGRPRKDGTSGPKKPAPPVRVPTANGEKRGRGRPRKGEEKKKTPKPAAVGVGVGVGSRTRSRATG